MKKLVSSAALVTLAVLAACNAKNTDMQAPPETFQAVTIEAARTQTLADPKVNILFVVDNSGSMKGYQDKLAQNMKLFSEKFFANSRIDYKIGVVPVYDSKYLNDQTVYAHGLRKMNALGQLVHLKGLVASDNQNQVFVTRQTKNPQQVLEQTVAIGTQWGPEAEESFSPVLAITDATINAEKNQGFYEKDAYLAVIFLTDADDVTPGLSGEDFYQQLVDLKDGDMSKVLIAAALPNINNHSAECTTDGRGPLQAFPALLAKSGALYADLCSKNFGSKLADFGALLVARVGAQAIKINFTPDITSLQVSYGPANSKESERIEIPRGTGYFYVPETEQILISSDFKVAWQPGYKIFIKAIQANLGNYKNGRLNKI